MEILIRIFKLSLFQQRTIKELLWGYKDPVLPGLTGLFVNVSKETLTLYTSK